MPNWKETNKYKDDDAEAENSREEEDADCGNAKDDLSLDEVLHLGGTRVRFLTHVYSG